MIVMRMKIIVIEIFVIIIIISQNKKKICSLCSKIIMMVCALRYFDGSSSTECRDRFEYRTKYIWRKNRIIYELFFFFGSIFLIFIILFSRAFFFSLLDFFFPIENSNVFVVGKKNDKIIIDSIKSSIKFSLTSWTYRYRKENIDRNLIFSLFFLFRNYFQFQS